MSERRFAGFSYEDPLRPLLSVAYFDGYGFGDRLLEGVIFRAEIVNGKLRVSFARPDGDYERGLNQKKWLPLAQDFAEDNDIFSDTADWGGEDVALEPAGS